MEKKEHPLKNYPEEEKVDYLAVVGSMASVDGEVTDDEIAQLREFCKDAGLSGGAIGRVVASTEAPDNVRVEEVISRLSESDLKFTLLTDLLFLAHADEEVDAEEEDRIDEIAAELNIEQERLEAIRKYVSAVVEARNSDAEKNLGEAAANALANVAGAGVPIGAVAAAGTSGLSAAGMTSGLAALGLGLGMAGGIGAVALLGIGAYTGVHAIYNRIKD